MSRTPSRASRTTELGEEIQCARCKEFWPADNEFFYTSHGKLHSWCKACYRADPKIIAKTERWKLRMRKPSVDATISQ